MGSDAGASGSPGDTNEVDTPEELIGSEEPMTGVQATYLKGLSEEAHEPFDESLTKAQASKRIYELTRKTRRGSKGLN